MKNSKKLFARFFMLCLMLSISGGLYARPGHWHNHPPKKHHYYYYPRQNVYYDPVESTYFVWERSYWKPVSHIPGRYVAFAYSDAPRVELQIASVHPYYYNVEHRRTYVAYRTPAPVPRTAQARVRVDSRPKPNVSFHFEINSRPEPQPVYVEERVIVVKERGHGHDHHPGHGHGHGHGHGRGHGHH